MANNPALVVRVAANLAELKKNLKEGKDQIEVTAAAMGKLSNSFSGDKLIQSAHGVTAAINKVGVATLSTSEGARSLGLLDKAMDKLLRTGQQVPVEMSRTAAELRRMQRATEGADAAVASVSAQYRKFDGILASMGINVGPYVRGLEDLAGALGGVSAAAGGTAAAGATGAGAAAAGATGAGAAGGTAAVGTAATATTAAIGLLTGALAVVATATAAWKVGKHAGELYGWTEAIARGTAALRGYGDVAEQTAQAQADAIALVGQYEINLKRQAESIAATTKATEVHTEATRRNWSVTEGNAGAMLSLAGQLDALKQKRLDDAKAAFAASQAQSIFGTETEKATVAVRAQTDALSEREQSLKDIADHEAARKAHVNAFMSGSSSSGQPTTQTVTNEQRMRGVVATAPDGTELTRTLSGDLISFNEKAKREADAKTRSFDLKPLTATELRKLGADKIGGTAVDGTFNEKNIWSRLKFLEGIEGTKKPSNNKEFFALQREMTELAQLRMWAEGKERPPGFAGGVTNFRGGLARVHQDELLVNLPRGTDVIPAGRSGGVTINLVVHVNGAASGSPTDIGAAVRDAIIDIFRTSGIQIPANI